MNPSPWRIFLKATLLFVVFNLLLALFPSGQGVRWSVYNHLVPGRERLPFGENPSQAYNLSLFDVEAMFASHVVSAQPSHPEYRVFIMGDSSVWGILLRPEETLAGQLNAMHLMTADRRPVRFYNLGYPTISLTKDLLLLARARQEKPDLILWLTTLEAFPPDKQHTPLVEHNRALLASLSAPCLPPPPMPSTDPLTALWQRTLFGRRRAWANWYRLQVYGVMWGITGIDQFYPKTYTPAKIDLAADDTFHGLHQGSDLQTALDWSLLDAGFCLAGETPIILVNEPILVSHGKNSDIRYNYFYPRWAYDQYRRILQDTAVKKQWYYLDLWHLVPATEFTNSAVHLTPHGEALLAEQIRHALQQNFLGTR